MNTTTAIATVQQAPGLYRTDLQHSDLAVPGRVVIPFLVVVE